MLDAFAPLLVLLAFVLLAATSWLWGEDTATASLTAVTATRPLVL